MTTPTPTDAPPTRPPGSPWPIPDAAAFLSISERHLHRLLDANKVKSVRLGRRRLIPDAEVQRLARDGC
ncbi:MAG: Helix-turn-helix domain protein [Gemmataceae bacterium]|nr:Helix-turn-helix domain protein [Gemmataceae bacterium]